MQNEADAFLAETATVFAVPADHPPPPPLRRPGAGRAVGGRAQATPTATSGVPPVSLCDILFDEPDPGAEQVGDGLRPSPLSRPTTSGPTSAPLPPVPARPAAQQPRQRISHASRRCDSDDTRSASAPTAAAAPKTQQSDGTPATQPDNDDAAEEEEEGEPSLDNRTFPLPMLTRTHEELVWEDCPFFVKGMVRICTPSDSHQVYHAILNAISLLYRDRAMNGAEVKPVTLVKMLRAELAAKLVTPDPQRHGRMPYDELMSGAIRQFAQTDEMYTIAHLQHQLTEASFIPRVLLEFVCDSLMVDLYFISGMTRTVEPAGSAVKGRRSVVLVYANNHYELIGVKKARGSNIDTVFCPDNPFIVRLRNQFDS